MQCPKCGKQLKLRTDSKGEKWYSHTYSFAHVMSDKPMCDYSIRVSNKGNKGNRYILQ